jgi:hypothetical protein
MSGRSVNRSSLRCRSRVPFARIMEAASIGGQCRQCPIQQLEGHQERIASRMLST